MSKKYLVLLAVSSLVVFSAITIYADSPSKIASELDPNHSLGNQTVSTAFIKKILLYTTRNWGTGSGSRRWDYDEDLPSILAPECFSVMVEDRETLPELTSAILDNYDQLWFVSTEESPILSSNEIQAIMDFHNEGKGILVMGDGCCYTVPANQFSPSLGVQFISSSCCHCDHCGGPLGCAISTSEFVSHEMWNNVSEIQANLTEGDLTASAPAQIIASHWDINMIAVRDADGGRVAWDATWYRFTDASSHPDLSITHCDNAQYVRNLAHWLAERLCGDLNGDTVINSADVVYLINYLFKGGPAPDPLWVGDVNCDGIINSADVVYLINYLFKGGPPPIC
jgi:hypothetical protein